MVENQLRARDIEEESVLEAMRDVPRHCFVPPALVEAAYEDRALKIGEGQTISQPYIVALMTQWLQVRAGQRILEIGTGSGYQSAVLATMGTRVFSVERSDALASEARRRIDRLGVADRVRIRVGDGSVGWAEEAPFDGILVTAAAPHVPDRCREQLGGAGGRMVLPVGDRQMQRLTLIERRGDRFEQTYGIACRFVPLLGQDAWAQ